jgi:FKBP12-rapamycin complex-associated protein
MIHDLLCKISDSHPRALIYPLTVASQSPVDSRKTAADAVLDYMKKECGPLVNEAHMVSQELIRCSVLWNELWHKAIEDASRAWFGQAGKAV